MQRMNVAIKLFFSEPARRITVGRVVNIC